MGVPDVVTDFFLPIYDNESEVRQILFVADIFHLEQQQLAISRFTVPGAHVHWVGSTDTPMWQG